MRPTAVLVAISLSVATVAANAAVPKSIAVLLGPSVGYLLSQSELCEWGLNAKIENTYKRAFETLGMTQAQRTAAWAQATAKQKELATLPLETKGRMKAGTCTAESRAQVERDISD